jgi:anti-sigma B factor antagonist
MASLQIDISHSGKEGDIALISAKGFVDTITVRELEEKILSQLAVNTYKFVIDMKKISYVNSSGWGVFLRELKEIRDHGGDLVLARMSPDVFDVYEKMEFSSILKAFETLEEAIESFTHATA